MNLPPPPPHSRIGNLLLLAWWGLAGPVFAEQVHEAATPEDLRALCAKVQPGDTIQLPDGEWKDAELRLRVSGTAELPVTIRTSEYGKHQFTGNSLLDLNGEHVVVEGLQFTSGSLAEGQADAVIRFRGNHCRLTRCGIVRFNPEEKSRGYNWVQLDGHGHQVDRCEFVGQDHRGVTLAVILTADGAGEHRITHNHFAGRASGDGRNGFETIRIGTSQTVDKNARTIFESNLFEDCNGEVETISNKSCENIYRSNTLLRCQGALTLRHGNRCLVESNVILGEGTKQTGGIRVHGEGHRIVANYIGHTSGRCDAAIALGAGKPDAASHEYLPVRDVEIRDNILVENEGAAFLFDYGYQSRGRTLLPEEITLSGNRIWSSAGDPLVTGTPIESATWKENTGFGIAAGAAPAGVSVRPFEAEPAPKPSPLGKKDVGPES